MSTVRLFNLFSFISRRSSRSCKKKVCDCRKDDRCQNTVFARELVLCTFSAFSAVCSWIQYSEILVCNIEYMKGKFFFSFFFFCSLNCRYPEIIFWLFSQCCHFVPSADSSYLKNTLLYAIFLNIYLILCFFLQKYVYHLLCLHYSG